MRTLCRKKFLLILLISCSGLLLLCGNIPVKKYYILNYEPEMLRQKKASSPYPCTIRIKEFDIEQVYDKPQIVYRKSPFELQYYFYRVWAVDPTRMITDIVYKHLVTASLVSHVIRRLDQGFRPDYELSGMIEALEEYDSDEVWFAHLALRVNLTRIRDNKTIYTKRFDRRKQVFQHSPEYVVRDLSQILDFIVTQALYDIDSVLAQEYGASSVILPRLDDSLASGDRSE